MAPIVRSPYRGPSRRLVIAFDIGTTYSGISYSILTPGEIPVISPVTRFPYQGHVGGNCKIPTVIYYDERGQVCATGVDELGDVGDPEEVENWTKIKWFKMHLRPKSSTSFDAADQITPLPPNKTVIDVFVDFMKYLCKCTRDYLQETYPNQPDLWATMERNNAIDFVLTHPNGWEGSQQSQMRQAAIRAGLVPDTSAGHARVRFVTEGEASLHLCIQRGLTTPAMEKGEGVLIVDAGGGTIDISAYSRNIAGGANSFEEIAAAQCFFQGSIYVTNRARCFIENHLRGSNFQRNVEYLVNEFDKKTKLTFKNKPIYVQINSHETDKALGIRGGALRLAANDVATFFQPSIDSIIKAIKDQRKVSKKTISTVFLVGGFAASDWLFSQIKQAMDPLGIGFYRPDNHTNKAVADGGVSYFIDHAVTARVSKYTYGIRCSTQYNSSNQEHLKRSSQLFRDADGDQLLPNSFSTILPKDTRVSERKEFRQSYTRTSTTKSGFGSVIDPILFYKGTSGQPRWTDEDAGSYSTLCNIVDNGQLLNIATYSSKGNCYSIVYEIVLSFGLTELTAQHAWKENGVEKRSTAKINYDFQ